MNVWFILHFLLNVEFYSECVGSLFYTFFPSNSEAGHGDVVWSRDGRPIAYRSGR